MRTFATFPDIIVYATPPHIVYYKFAHSSLVGRVAIEADGVVIAPLHSYKVFTVTHIYILYAVWCCPVRREGRQSRLVAMQSRHWLSACAVGSLRGPCRPCRCVPIRCNTCQSYSINTMLSLPTEVRVLVVPPPRLSPFADRSVRWRDVCGQRDCRGHGLGRRLCENVA